MSKFSLWLIYSTCKNTKRKPQQKKSICVNYTTPCWNFLPLYCFSELDRPLKDSAWTRHCWERDIAAEAEVLLLGPEHRLTRPSAVELTVRPGPWRNTGWHTPCHAGQGLRVCWHSVSHPVRRPQWEQTSTRIPRVSSTSTITLYQAR